MDATLADLLRPVLYRLANSLASANCRVSLMKLGASLPAAITSLFGFESRLSTDDPAVDFLMHVDGSTGAPAVLTEALHPAGCAATSPLQGPVWERIGTFARTWSEPGRGLREQISAIWLEFDTATHDVSGGGLPQPSLFVAPTRTTTDTASPPAIGARSDGRLTLIETVVQLLREVPLPDAVSTQVEACLGALPRASGVIHIGLMLARPGDGVRLCIGGLGMAGIPPYLARLGHGALGETVTAQLAPWAAHISRIYLNLDVEAAIVPRVGAECYAPLTPTSETVLAYELTRWRPLFDDLVDGGYCTPERRDALLDYVGFALERSSPDLWPTVHSGKPIVLMRHINHVKFQCEVDRPLVAKAYLAARYASVAQIPAA